MKIKIITIAIISLLGLSGCFNGSSSNGNNNNEVSAAKAGIQAYSSKTEADEAVEIDDAEMLRDDISTLFGNPDGEPIAVEDNDTVQDVINSL